jgi:hypothetical protein
MTAAELAHYYEDRERKIPHALLFLLMLLPVNTSQMGLVQSSNFPSLVTATWLM